MWFYGATLGGSNFLPTFYCTPTSTSIGISKGEFWDLEGKVPGLSSKLSADKGRFYTLPVEEGLCLRTKKLSFISNSWILPGLLPSTGFFLQEGDKLLMSTSSPLESEA